MRVLAFVVAYTIAVGAAFATMRAACVARRWVDVIAVSLCGSRFTPG